MVYAPAEIDTSSNLIEQTKFVLAVVAVIWYTTVWLVSTLGNLQVCVLFHCSCVFTASLITCIDNLIFIVDDKFFLPLQITMPDRAQPHET